AYTIRRAMYHHHAYHLAQTHERGTNPIDGRRSNRNDLSISNEVREDLGRGQERTTRPKNILGEAAAQRLPRRSAFLLVDEVGEVQSLGLIVVEGDVEVRGGHQAADHLVDLAVQLGKVSGRIRGLRAPVQG